MMIGLLVLICVLGYIWYGWLFKERSSLPPGPLPLPLLGTTYHFFGSAMPHEALMSLSRKFGSVFTMWLGNEPNVIINDYETLQKCVGGKDADAFEGRPASFVFRSFYKGNHGIITSDGVLWEEQRKFAINTLKEFGMGKNLMEAKVAEEADILAGKISARIQTDGYTLIDLDSPLQAAVGSIISSVIFGHRFDEDDPRFAKLKATIEEDFILLSKPETLLMAQYPLLRYIPHFSRIFNTLMSNRDNFVGMIQKEIAEHREQFDPNSHPSDFLDAYLQKLHIKETPHGLESFTEWQLTVSILDLWAAGMNPSVATLRWIFLFLANRPQIQAQIHEELDSFYGESSRMTTMEDKQHLPLLSAAILESQRLANIAPINVQRRVTRVVRVRGFNLPRDTVVIPQIASIHMDENFFPDPKRFDPQRFLDSTGSKVVKSEQILPFSIGKRLCPADNLAKMELFLIVATLLRQFRFSYPDSKLTEKPVFGLTLKPEQHKLKVEAR